MPPVRFDWYQTEDQVTVSFMLKNAIRENVDLDISAKTVELIYSEPKQSVEHTLNLAHEIDPKRSRWSILPSKIELKLRKVEDIRWINLEADPQFAEVVSSRLAIVDIGDTGDKPKCPYTTKKDWDKIAFELKKAEEGEKAEGDEAVNDLFGKIYQDGDDDVKKAMIKSFSESGGTCLSTSWKDVKTKKVEVKPPDGVEYKKWNS